MQRNGDQEAAKVEEKGIEGIRDRAIRAINDRRIQRRFAAAVRSARP
jgi:hypothetical protein